MEKHTIITLKNKGYSNREIARQTGFDRKTISKYWQHYLRSLANLDRAKNELSREKLREAQEIIVSSPKYNTENRKFRKYTPEIDVLLDSILESEKEKCKILGLTHKQKLTNRQIHQLITEQNFDIGITVVSEHIKKKRNKLKETFIRQEYQYGQRLEYDFGNVSLVIGGNVCKYSLAVLSAPASKFRWAYLYQNQKQEVFLDSQIRFFEMIGGVHKEIVYDNMKNVVFKFIGKNEKKLNPELIKMSLYYGFEINVTNCFRGNEKGFVENSVKLLRNKIFAVKYQFESFEQAQLYLEAELVKLNSNATLEEEKPHLLPSRPKLELASISKQNVDKSSLIRIENNFYSVPEYLTGKSVIVKNYLQEIFIYSDTSFVCSHKKIDGFGNLSINIFHYLDTLAKKPGALKNSMALKCRAELKTIYEQYFTQKTKEFIALLKENKDKNIDEIVEICKIYTTSPSATTNITNNDIDDNIQRYTKKQLSQLTKMFLKGDNQIAN